MRPLKILGILAGLGVFGFLHHWAESVRALPDPRATLKILDRQGVLLEEKQNLRFGRRSWVPLTSISSFFLQAVIDQEDRRFYEHFGIDPWALGRALWANLRSGRLSQGGSTITQQTAKILLENWKGERVPRSLFWKMAEVILALDLELHETKSVILERYLNSVYLGHRLYGVEAASQAYFAKTAKDLTREESALLAERIRRPNRGREILIRSRFDSTAPHLATMISHESDFEEGRGDRVIATTVDANIQALSLDSVRRELAQLRQIDPALQAAAVVIDIPSGELRALVGSEDFDDLKRGGQVNHAIALRQPGSTLKPFTYFLSFLHHRHPAHLVLDAPYHFYLAEDESYTPRNFDRQFHGVLSIREALANSYNIPAVLMLEELGSAAYLHLLQRFGFSSLTQGPTYYGLALTLGSGSVRLTELTTAYAALGRGGEYKPLRVTQGVSIPSDKTISRLPTPEEARASFYVTSILSDPEARRSAFGEAELMNLDRQVVAVKTGTSHGSRDAWAVGYTPRYAVGIWTGHTDNSPMPGFTGAEAAIPIWNAIMSRLHEGLSPVAFTIPSGVKPKAFCRDENCDVVKADWDRLSGLQGPNVPRPDESLRILTPVDGDHFLIDPRQAVRRQKVFCEARLPQSLTKGANQSMPLRWILDGQEIETGSLATPKTFLDLNPGRHELKVALGDQKSRTVRITVSEISKGE